MKHTIIYDPLLNGWEYGMLRSFERVIIEEMHAVRMSIPTSRYDRIIHHFGHGMDWGKYRKYFQRESFGFEGDAIWYILMGPENYRLDLFKDWQDKSKVKILYLFDTMPSQYRAVKRICERDHWDILVTSFNDAREDLEKLTGRSWHAVEQAVDDKLFKSVPFNERVIHFSSYGRRDAKLHGQLLEYCDKHGLYYDYTTHDGRHPIVDSSELYKQYAWHLSHSVFTFSWPVEMTNPQRAGHLRPVTCRWFEAVGAGTVIVGQEPGNKDFRNYFGAPVVEPFPFNAGKAEVFARLDELMAAAPQLYDRINSLREEKLGQLNWQDRVHRIWDIAESKKK